MSKEYLETLNNTFDYGVQSVLDGLLIRGYNPKKMLEQECLGNTLEKDLDEAKIKITDLTSVKKYMIKSQDLEKENTRYKELEEQLGCPLEVFVELHNRAHIYDVKGKPLKVVQVLSDTVVVKTLQGKREFMLLEDYKKSFWLKKDKTE